MNGWPFFRFALIVTGKGERAGIDRFLRAIHADGQSTCTVTDRVPQLIPVGEKKRAARELKMVGKGGRLEGRDEQIGLIVRSLCFRGFDYVILIDDLEKSGRNDVEKRVERYVTAGRGLIADDRPWRFSVHFLVNMMESYFFADTNPASEVLGAPVSAPAEFPDVEDIPHAKSLLRELSGNKYREASDAPPIDG